MPCNACVLTWLFSSSVLLLVMLSPLPPRLFPEDLLHFLPLPLSFFLVASDPQLFPLRHVPSTPTTRFSRFPSSRQRRSKWHPQPPRTCRILSWLLFLSSVTLLSAGEPHSVTYSPDFPWRYFSFLTRCASLMQFPLCHCLSSPFSLFFCFC